MRIIALEVEKPNASAADLTPLLKAEARKAWDLYQDGFIREFYFRADQTLAVLILECEDVAMAKSRLAELPLVAAGLIDFEIIPLKPYLGFARLFTDQG